MSNRYGITLDSEWIEWAANEKVSETVAAAVLLICQTRPLHEVVAKLSPADFKRVVDIVRHAPDHFPSETLAALESRSPLPARQPTADSIPADQSRRQSTKPQSGKERGSIGNLFGIALDQASLQWAAAESVSENVIAAILLLHERSVDEVAGKLTPAELADATRLVSRCPTCYPPGTLAALRNLTPPPQPPRTGVSTDQAPSRLAARTGAEGPHRHRPNARKRAGRPFEHPPTTPAMPTYAKNPGTRGGALAETVRRRMVRSGIYHRQAVRLNFSRRTRQARCRYLNSMTVHTFPSQGGHRTWLPAFSPKL